MHTVRPYLVLCLCLTALLVSGCGSKSTMESFLRDEVDLTHVTRVAVVPFENNSKEPFAPERVRGMAITEILSQGLFDVVDKGLVDSAFRDEAVDLTKGPMDGGAMKRLGQRLNVQAFLLGSIDQAGDVQRGPNSYPVLSMTLRLVDINTGMIFWQASGSRTGDSISKRLFGLGADDEFKVALRLLRQLLSTISSERKVKLPVAVTASPTFVEPEKEAAPTEEADAAEETATPEAHPDPATQELPEDEDLPMGLDESLGQPPATEQPPAEIESLTEEEPAPALEEAPAAEASTTPEPEEEARPATEEPQPAQAPAPAAPDKAPQTLQQWEQAWPE